MSKPARKQGSPSGTGKTGSLRIIGGKWRGRKLPVLQAEGLRPTTDRVRETLFNWLQFELADARVLDLFAGSGALGLEALSRGASHCTFVEQHAPAAQQLNSNLTRLEVTDSARVQKADALAVLKQAPTVPFTVVFIDPPFRQQLLAQVLPLLSEQGWLAANAWVYVETEREWTGKYPPNWHLHREKHAGQVSYRLFKLEDAPA